MARAQPRRRFTPRLGGVSASGARAGIPAFCMAREYMKAEVAGPAGGPGKKLPVPGQRSIAAFHLREIVRAVQRVLLLFPTLWDAKQLEACRESLGAVDIV